MDFFHSAVTSLNFLMPKPIQLLLLFIVLSSCNSKQYTIKDFRASLQPGLTKIVTSGIVGYSDDSTLSKIATDEELLQLSRSEHPVLRASALREILSRKSIDHFNVIMNHLNDTALVPTDAGEFGIWFRTVSDDLLQEATWKTQEAKNKTIEQVLTRHNYLHSAYEILLQIEPQEKYYPFIKDMATRPRRLTDEGYELDFGVIEKALYGLAKFEKPEDRNIIRKALSENAWQISHTSFRLMKEFPDNDYAEIFQTYYPSQFYRFTGNRRGGFSGYEVGRADPEDFINALVVQKTNWSAKLLDTMLITLPRIERMPDKKNIYNDIVMAIWDHPCPAYAKLREKIKGKAKELLKWRIGFDLDPIEMPVDTTDYPIRW